MRVGSCLFLLPPTSRTLTTLSSLLTLAMDEEEVPAPADGSYTPYKRRVHIYLEELDCRTPEERLTLRPNGFTEYTSVQDYPVRNRLLTLHMRRRRYIGPDDRNTVPCIFPLKAKGTSISPEFAAFLKGGA